MSAWTICWAARPSKPHTRKSKRKAAAFLSFCAPHFLLSCQKKMRRARWKRKPLVPPNGHSPFAANTGVRERDHSKFFSQSVGRGRKCGIQIGFPPRDAKLGIRAKTDFLCFYFRAPRCAAVGGLAALRMRHTPCGCFAQRCPGANSGVGNPKGRGRNPSPLCRFKGVRGEIEILPGFSSRGLGAVLFSKENGPQAFPASDK